MSKSPPVICYLCGKLGADSKDHVPPKGLLPAGNYRGQQRITVPAHKSCNSSASGDEEYLRDVLIQEAALLNLPEASTLSDKVWRAWSKSGWNRYQRFLENARLVQLRTPSGIYAGRATAVNVDRDRVKAVGIKIFRGIVYHDTGAFLGETDPGIAILSVHDAWEEREKSAHQPFWTGMSSNYCHHDAFADSVVLRRFYEALPTADGTMIAAHVAVVLWNLFCVCSTVFPLATASRKDLRLAIDTNIWIQNDPPSKK